VKNEKRKMKRTNNMKTTNDGKVIFIVDGGIIIELVIRQ